MEVEGEIWYKITCPDDECGVVNFVYGGYFPDPDCSKMEVDGFTCWKCKKEFDFMDDEESCMFEDGRKSPCHEN